MVAGFDVDRIDYEKDKLFEEWFGEKARLFPSNDPEQEKKNIKKFIAQRKKKNG